MLVPKLSNRPATQREAMQKNARGQAFEWSVKNKDLMRDSSGKVVSFASPVDALNFLNNQGWVMVNASADAGYFSAVMQRPKK
jgi:hypothetical protein